MVRATALTLLLAQVDPNFLNQVEAIEPDVGQAWVHINESPDGDEYTIRPQDLRPTAGNYEFRVWVRGYHARNRRLPYRETRALYLFNCRARTYQQLAITAWRANRTVAFSTSRASYPDYVVPGSLSEDWLNAVCPH